MDTTRAKALLGGLTKIETGGRNDIKPGTVQVLISQVAMEESRDFKPYIRSKATVLVPIMDGKGRKPWDEEYNGHFKGEEISFCFFFGDRFQKDFSRFLCAALDISPEDAKGVTGDELQQMALSIIKLDDQPSGTLDGNTVIEMRGVESAPVEDKKNPGKLKTYTNERYDKHVPLEDLMDSLDEQDIARYFGSMEHFAALCEAAAE